MGKEAARTGKSVRDLVLEMELLDEATLDEVLSPENLLNPTFQGKLYTDYSEDVPQG